MPAQTVLRWRDGRGWLVLSAGQGEAQELDAIRALALQRTSADGGMAIAYLGDEAGIADRMLDDLEDLGAPSGYLVDVISEDDETVRSRLTEAAVIVIFGANDAVAARSSLKGAAIEGIGAAHANGAVILVEGIAAMTFGAHVIAPDGSLTDGLAWLERGLVAPNVIDIGAYARPILTAQPESVGVGIGAGAALALGPDGQIEIWGAKRVAVALGSAYQTGG